MNHSENIQELLGKFRKAAQERNWMERVDFLGKLLDQLDKEQVISLVLDNVQNFQPQFLEIEPDEKWTTMFLKMIRDYVLDSSSTTLLKPTEFEKNYLHRLSRTYKSMVLENLWRLVQIKEKNNQLVEIARETISYSITLWHYKAVYAIEPELAYSKPMDAKSTSMYFKITSRSDIADSERKMWLQLADTIQDIARN